MQELYTAFKEKHSNINSGFSKFCALRPKWCVLAGSKMSHSVWFCSAHQNVVLLFDAVDWDLTYKHWSRRSFTTLRATNTSCISANPVLALKLWKNFFIRNSTNVKTVRNLKLTVGVKSTASYIPWLYTTWDQIVASKMIHCVVLMTTTITQAFCIKFKQCLFIILKLFTHIS